MSKFNLLSNLTILRVLVFEYMSSKFAKLLTAQRAQQPDYLLRALSIVGPRVGEGREAEDLYSRE